jgi:hypothetical protein
MASIRQLKKDIDYLLSLVLEECMYVAHAYPEADKEKIFEIAGKVISSHRELRLRINHLNGKDNPALVREYLRKIVDDLYLAADGALENLAATINPLQ